MHKGRHLRNIVQFTQVALALGLNYNKKIFIADTTFLVVFTVCYVSVARHIVFFNEILYRAVTKVVIYRKGESCAKG